MRTVLNVIMLALSLALIFIGFVSTVAVFVGIFQRGVRP